MLKATKVEYQKLYKENKQLKDYILQQNQHKQQLEQQQQQYYYKKEKQLKNINYVTESESKYENTPVNSDYETGDEKSYERAVY